MSLYFTEFTVSCTFTRFTGPSEVKQTHSITNPSPYLSVSMSGFSTCSSYASQQTLLESLFPKVSSDQDTQSYSNSRELSKFHVFLFVMVGQKKLSKLLMGT
ncbi:hypothetical protein ATANTOWER_020673 [Ataeniobius toweri]|uniref:Uncharacterized protein n=1 Tax=Ataeniobius toweri TaxID=208326 RepID=A0ABU7ART4_9TELE|nr:hypothetical protein [Ataeniobius toweri]